MLFNTTEDKTAIQIQFFEQSRTILWNPRIFMNLNKIKGDSDAGDDFWMLVPDVVYQNGHNRHQHLTVVTNIFCLQYRSPHIDLYTKE